MGNVDGFGAEARDHRTRGHPTGGGADGPTGTMGGGSAAGGRVPGAEIARRLELDRKTVRRCLRDPAWRPYQRPARPRTLLAPYAESLQARVPEVGYSAQILFQELRQRGYRGSYDTVKLFVRPLRADQLSTERTLRRFETPPGRP